MSKFQEAKKSFDKAVDEKAAELIETGQAGPWEAMEMATEQIKKMRRQMPLNAKEMS